MVGHQGCCRALTFLAFQFSLSSSEARATGTLTPRTVLFPGGHHETLLFVKRAIAHHIIHLKLI